MTDSNLPDHLTLRIEVHGDNGKTISSGRGEDVLKVASRNAQDSSSPWDDAFSKYEKKGLTDWPGDLIPEHIEVVTSKNSVPLYGYPALKDTGESVDLILCKSAAEAHKIHISGVKKMIEILLLQEFAWIERELKFTQQLKLLCVPFGGADSVKRSLIVSIHDYLLHFGSDAPRSKVQFENTIASARVKGQRYRI